MLERLTCKLAAVVCANSCDLADMGSVREVPITFTERRLGESKMSRRIVLEAAWMVPALRLTDERGSRRWAAQGQGDAHRRGARR